MTERLTIVAPLPTRRLFPNARSHWRPKAKETSKNRNASRVAAISAVRSIKGWRSYGFPWSDVVVRITWYRKTRRVIDADNALAALKSTIDGVVDSAVLDDDRELIYLPIEFDLDKKNPRVEITLTKRVPGVCPLCSNTREDESEREQA